MHIIGFQPLLLYCSFGLIKQNSEQSSNKSIPTTRMSHRMLHPQAHHVPQCSSNFWYVAREAIEKSSNSNAAHEPLDTPCPRDLAPQQKQRTVAEERSGHKLGMIAELSCLCTMRTTLSTTNLLCGTERYVRVRSDGCWERSEAYSCGFVWRCQSYVTTAMYDATLP